MWGSQAQRQVAWGSGRRDWVSVTSPAPWTAPRSSGRERKAKLRSRHAGHCQAGRRSTLAATPPKPRGSVLEEKRPLPRELLRAEVALCLLCPGEPAPRINAQIDRQSLLSRQHSGASFGKDIDSKWLFATDKPQERGRQQRPSSLYPAAPPSRAGTHAHPRGSRDLVGGGGAREAREAQGQDVRPWG